MRISTYVRICRSPLYKVSINEIDLKYYVFVKYNNKVDDTLSEVDD